MRLVLVAWALCLVPGALWAADPCDSCKPIEQKLAAAKQELADLQKKQAKLNADLAANRAQQQGTQQEIQDITDAINRQADTFARTTDEGGTKIEARYDLTTGEIVTTRTPPGGAPTTTRTKSKDISNKLAQKAALENRLANEKVDEQKLQNDLNQTQTDIQKTQAKIKELEDELDECRKQRCGPIELPQLLIDPTGQIAFVVKDPANLDAVLEEYGITPTGTFALPEGGVLVSTTKPGDGDKAATAELKGKLDKDLRVDSVEDNYCRVFLPSFLDWLIPPAHAVVTGPGTAQGAVVAPGGGPIAGATLVIVPPIPQPGQAAPEWDGSPPIHTQAGPDGSFTFTFPDDPRLDDWVVLLGASWNQKKVKLSDVANGVPAQATQTDDTSTGQPPTQTPPTQTPPTQTPSTPATTVPTRTTYTLPQPGTTLPGRSDDWTPDALDLLAVMNKWNIGAPMLDRFYDAGGIFTRTDVELPRGTQAVYNTGDDVIKLNSSKVNADGTLGRMTRSDIATITHETWHAYRDQVVNNGYDPTTKKVIDDAAEWLKKQTLRESNGTKTVVANDLYFFDEVEFIDEYIGAIINDLVTTHVRVTQRINDGTITPAQAQTEWQNGLNRIKGYNFSAYEDSEAPVYEVQSPPPPELVDHMVNILDLGY